MPPSMNMAHMPGISRPTGACGPGGLSHLLLESSALPMAMLNLDAARPSVTSFRWGRSSRSFGASELPSILGKTSPGCAFLRASASKGRISALRRVTSWLMPADQTFLLTKFRCVSSGALAILGGSRISASSRCALCLVRVRVYRVSVKVRVRVRVRVRVNVRGRGRGRGSGARYAIE